MLRGRDNVQLSSLAITALAIDRLSLESRLRQALNDEFVLYQPIVHLENGDQLSFLRQHQFDEVQGFLFSPPVAAAEFRNLLLRRQSLPASA